MTIQSALQDRKMTIYKLAQLSQVPYATCNDIINGKAKLEKCSAETIYKIAHALSITMEEILSPCFVKRSSFENFKSTVCHRLKEKGDIQFIIETLESADIRTYFNRKWYPESMYLLAMVDYVSRENNVPLCMEYDDIRSGKLEKPVYPASLLASATVSKNNDVLMQARETAIPEFKRFNIIENEVRNVI